MTENQYYPARQDTALPVQQFSKQPDSWTKEGRAIAKNNREAVVEMHQITAEAAKQDLANELGHRIACRQQDRREMRLNRTLELQEKVFDTVSAMDNGDLWRYQQRLEMVEAWRRGEMYRLATD